MTNIYCLVEGNFDDLENLTAGTEELVGAEPNEFGVRSLGPLKLAETRCVRVYNNDLHMSYSRRMSRKRARHEHLFASARMLEVCKILPNSRHSSLVFSPRGTLTGLNLAKVPVHQLFYKWHAVVFQ